MSFVGQAYPGIQLSANEKKSGGSICLAPELLVTATRKGPGAKSERGDRRCSPLRARGRAYLGQNFLRLASCVVLSEDRLSQPAYELGWLTRTPCTHPPILLLLLLVGDAVLPSREARWCT